MQRVALLAISAGRVFVAARVESGGGAWGGRDASGDDERRRALRDDGGPPPGNVFVVASTGTGGWSTGYAQILCERGRRPVRRGVLEPLGSAIARARSYAPAHSPAGHGMMTE
jgi:hypothetical protein